jgi:hypothetical protein
MLAWAGSAHAQHHHGAESGPVPESTVRLQLSAVAARLDPDVGQGGYGGLVAGARYQRGRIAVDVLTALWDLRRDGEDRIGLGDSAVDVEITAIERRGRAHLQAGGAAMLMLPTAEAGSGLGMGHTMLMAGAWAAAADERWAAVAGLSYAFALSAAAYHASHHHGDDLIDPNNASELAAHARVSRRIVGPWAGELAARGAAPIAVDHGVWRGVLGTGLRRNGIRWDVGVRAEVAIGGEPWGLRSMLDLQRRF